jgi:hypothetical protein
MMDETLQVAWGFGSALLLTILIEALVAWLLGLRTGRGQLILLLVNVITNPLLNLIMAGLAFFAVYTIQSPYDPLLIALEVLVVAAEALMLRAALGLSTGKAIMLSTAVNTASWLAGALILWR